jgi:hypothetical protein
LFIAPRIALELALPFHQRTVQEQLEHNEQDQLYGATSLTYLTKKLRSEEELSGRPKKTMAENYIRPLAPGALGILFELSI